MVKVRNRLGQKSNTITLKTEKRGTAIVAKKEVPTKDTNETREETQSPKGAGFIKETREELSKVVWPSRQQLLSESAAVILMVTLVATVIYLVDNFFAWAAGKVF